MRFPSRSFVFFPVACLLACQGAGGPGTISGPNPQVAAPLPLTRFRTDSTAFAEYSGVRVAENLVVRDAAAWSALWKSIHATVLPQPPVPAVDFDRDMIVAAALGERSTGGYNILLTGASADANGVEIRVLEVSPGANCVTTQALTQPIDLARMARRDDPVHFAVTRQVRGCGP